MKEFPTDHPVFDLALEAFNLHKTYMDKKIEISRMGAENKDHEEFLKQAQSKLAEAFAAKL